MNRLSHLHKLIIVGSALSSLLGCQAEPSVSAKYRKSLLLSQQIANLTQTNDALNQALAKKDGQVALKDLVKQDISDELKSSILGIEGYESLVLNVPVAEHRANLGGANPTMILVVPEGEESEITFLEGTDSNGKAIKISAEEAPNAPVITIGLLETKPSSQVDAVVVMSETAPEIITMSPAAAGNEASEAKAAAERAAQAKAAEDVRIAAALDEASQGGLKLDTVSFADDHEPWFKGDAEVYALLSFVDKSGTGVTKTIELKGAGKANKTYTMDKILHMWPENNYQFVDIAFMEHDSNADYSSVAAVVLKASASVTTLLYPVAAPAVLIVSDILEVALKAIPNKVFVDNDDYMDTINLVEKDKNQDKKGVKANVSATFSTFKVLHNNE